MFWYGLLKFLAYALTLLWGTVAFLRMFLQRGGLAASHPFAGFLVFATQWAVKPLRRFAKPVAGWDFAIPVAVLLLCLLERALILGVAVAVNPDALKPGRFVWEGAAAALLFTSCLANAATLVMIYRWLSFHFFFDGGSAGQAVEFVYKGLTKPVTTGNEKVDRFGHAVLFLFLFSWGPVIAPAIMQGLTG